MKTVDSDVWQRRGISLVWGNNILSTFSLAHEAKSIREFFEIVDNPPELLPSNNGKSLVVVGLEGCIDLLKPDQAEIWLRSTLLPGILNFQDEYGSEGGLIFWLPSGRNRIKMNRATESYLWTCAAPHSSQKLEIGRILWAGAETDVARIMNKTDGSGDLDSVGWIGLNLARLS